jgi:hypothetical protein
VVGIFFLVALMVSWFVPYPTSFHAPLSFASSNNRLIGVASVPASFSVGLVSGQSVDVELTLPKTENTLRLRAEIKSIAHSPQEDKAIIEFVLPLQTSEPDSIPLNGSWTVRISKNDGRRLFSALFT